MMKLLKRDKTAKQEAQRKAWLAELAEVSDDNNVPYEALHLAAVLLINGLSRDEATLIVADKLGATDSKVAPSYNVYDLLNQVEKMVEKGGHLWQDVDEVPFAMD